MTDAGSYDKFTLTHVASGGSFAANDQLSVLFVPKGDKGDSAQLNTDTTWQAKGDLAVATGNDAATILPVGADGYVLVADSAEATGVKWAAVSGTGDVTAASNFATDNRLIRSDGTGKGVQASGITVDDSANMSGVAALSATTIELGHASDTTISRSAAGTIAVEGVDVALNSISLAHTAGTIELGHATDTTISRTGAGAIAVEGVGVALNSTSLAHTAGTIELGHATDTTLARSGAGDITIEGNQVYRAGGTDVALADGGTGASLADPNADRIMFWDDSGGAVTWLEVGSGLSITDTTLSTIASGDVTAASAFGTDNRLIRSDGTGKGVQASGIDIDDSDVMTTPGRIIASKNGALSAPTIAMTGTPISGGTATTTKPLVLIEPSAATSTGWSTNGTLFGVNCVSGFTGRLFDFQVNGVTVFNWESSNGFSFGTVVRITNSGGRLTFSSSGAHLTAPAALTLQIGDNASGAPGAQTLQAQGSRAGTDTNIGGGNLTIQPGTGTGTGTAASLILRSPVTVASGTGAQTQTTGLTITSGIPYVPSYTVAGAPSAATAAGIIYVSNETGGAVLAFSDGTNWRRVTDRAIIS
jgi:hypothetical protein